MIFSNCSQESDHNAKGYRACKEDKGYFGSNFVNDFPH